MYLYMYIQYMHVYISCKKPFRLSFRHLGNTLLLKSKLFVMNYFYYRELEICAT